MIRFTWSRRNIISHVYDFDYHITRIVCATKKNSMIQLKVENFQPYHQMEKKIRGKNLNGDNEMCKFIFIQICGIFILNLREKKS